MTPSQEELALRSCHQLYNEFCEEDDDNYEEYDPMAEAEARMAFEERR